MDLQQGRKGRPKPSKLKEWAKFFFYVAVPYGIGCMVPDMQPFWQAVLGAGAAMLVGFAVFRLWLERWEEEMADRLTPDMYSQGEDY